MQSWKRSQRVAAVVTKFWWDLVVTAERTRDSTIGHGIGGGREERTDLGRAGADHGFDFYSLLCEDDSAVWARELTKLI
ncbi:hypothetical protein Vadar_000096 [Vaccinium darrowii]|uniref:Uncharacterized protein n=1 Tax=Vaccinium darrowii TaxID=229202 RepID=A0ACB7YJ93_9ERIC|nr:hypothetical protein Vadar_000096 [Vaccinium darrowii]